MIAMLDDSEKKKRRALERRWRSSKRECDYSRFNEEQCLRVNALIKKTKVDYCSGIIQESIYNPRTLFSTVNKLPHKGVPGGRRGGLMVSALDSGAVRVRVRALAGDIVLCSWARHFTFTVPLSTQVYKWVPAICWGNLTSRPGEVEILLAASCYRNRDKLRQL